MEKHLEKKVALVTGGAKGIGRATALAYAREGARVCVADIDSVESEETVRQIINAGGEAFHVRADLTRHADISAMVEATVTRYGQLDAAFNNAGTMGSLTNVVDCTEEEWDFVSALNLKSIFLCMKYEIPAMLAAGGGVIVNTASELVNHPAQRMVSYMATKAGVLGLSRSAAVDFAERNIRVNMLLPGPTDTPMLRKGSAGLDISLDGFANLVPMKRVGRAEEQADAVVWLTSARSSFVTGLAVSVDGGLNLK
jgi:NAD(P)-dependent dehydrogenase (short-subunit alcohol dehydrogenase family)